MKVKDMMKGIRWGQRVRGRNNPPVHILRTKDYDSTDTFHQAFCGTWQPEWKRASVAELEVCKTCLRVTS